MGPLPPALEQIIREPVRPPAPVRRPLDLSYFVEWQLAEAPAAAASSS